MPPRSSVRLRTVTVGLLPNLMSVLRGNNELGKPRKKARKKRKTATNGDR